jgi:uncharacterized protein YaaR (DUF327 family)
MQQVQGRSGISDVLNRNNSGVQARVAAEGAAGGEKFATLVSQILTRKNQASKDKTVEDLMSDLDSEEREFAEEPSRDRYEAYRKTVKLLCNLLLQRGYRLQGWEDHKKRRYEIVKTIDARLAQVYSGLLRRNQDVVIALHLMGQIRGLIFDLKA